MTAADSDKIRGSWSRDGRFIYFQSDRSGSRQIWKMPSGGGEAVQMTRGEGWDSQESWDGRYLFYAQSQVSTTIWKVPVEGGEETEVLQGPVRVHPDWAVSRDGNPSERGVAQPGHLDHRLTRRGVDPFPRGGRCCDLGAHARRELPLSPLVRRRTGRNHRGLAAKPKRL